MQFLQKIHLSTAAARFGQSMMYIGQRVILNQVSAPIVLEPPSTADYDLVAEPSKVYFSQWRQEEKLWPKFLQKMTLATNNTRKPFFVESGARDGETHSNTLFLERQKGWHGLLIEPDFEFNSLLGKHRKAWSFHGGLSPDGTSATIEFIDSKDGLSHQFDSSSLSALKRNSIRMTVPVVPLHELLQKINPPISTVDFWSLDIEGSEGGVLEHTDFSKVEVGALLVEMNKNEENNRRIRDALTPHGFIDVGGTRYDEGVLDHIFVLPSYFTSRGIPIPEPFGVV